MPEALASGTQGRRREGVVAHLPSTQPHTFRIFHSSFHDPCILLEPLGRGTHYNGLYRKAPPERGTFFRLQVYERVGVSLVELCGCLFLWLWKSRKRSSFVVWSRFKERALFYSSLKGYKVLN